MAAHFRSYQNQRYESPEGNGSAQRSTQQTGNAPRNGDWVRGSESVGQGRSGSVQNWNGGPAVGRNNGHCAPPVLPRLVSENERRFREEQMRVHEERIWAQRARELSDYSKEMRRNLIDDTNGTCLQTNGSCSKRDHSRSGVLLPEQNSGRSSNTGQGAVFTERELIAALFVRAMRTTNEITDVQILCSDFIKAGCTIPESSGSGICADRWACICKAAAEIRGELSYSNLIGTGLFKEMRKPHVAGTFGWWPYDIVSVDSLPLQQFKPKIIEICQTNKLVCLQFKNVSQCRFIFDMQATWSLCQTKNIVGGLNVDWYTKDAHVYYVVFLSVKEWARMNAWQLMMCCQRPYAADYIHVSRHVVQNISRRQCDKLVLLMTLTAFTALLVRRPLAFGKQKKLHGELRRICLASDSIFIRWCQSNQPDLFQEQKLMYIRRCLIIIMRQTHMKHETVMCQCALILIHMWTDFPVPGHTFDDDTLTSAQETYMIKLFGKLCGEEAERESLGLLRHPKHCIPCSDQNAKLTHIVCMCTLCPETLIHNPRSWMDQVRANRKCLCKLDVDVEKLDIMSKKQKLV